MKPCVFWVLNIFVLIGTWIVVVVQPDAWKYDSMNYLLRGDPTTRRHLQQQKQQEQQQWTTCAVEHGWAKLGVCTIVGTATVRYGANGKYVTKTVTNEDIVCSNEAFGIDPIGWTIKTCAVLSNDWQQQWITCAVENGDAEQGVCTVVGTATVRFGAEGKYVTKSVTDKIACNIKAFGSDPIFGKVKGCEVLSTTSRPKSNILQGVAVWGQVVRTTVIATAAANLPNGNILFWSGTGKFNFGLLGGTQTWTAIYSPDTERSTERLVKTNHEMFCPGTSMLSNGVLMVSGGGKSDATTFYDYRYDTWSVGPALTIPRGYHTHTVLADGRVLTIGGSWSGGQRNKNGEIWSPSTNKWIKLSGILSAPLETRDKEGIYRADNHYWLFTGPNGRVFHAGPSNQMHWIDVGENEQVVPSITRGDDNDAMNGNAILYDVGKILTLGGAANYASGLASNRAYIVDINGDEATVKRVGDMKHRRSLFGSVLLPSGDVIVVGGQSIVALFSDSNSIFEAELWSPITETFQTLPAMKIPRNYHSTALLMKDGRVWVGGGGLCGGCSADHPDFEIMNPPYLFNSNGQLATRPIIKSVSTKMIQAGESFMVTMDSVERHSFALVRLSSVTHSVNNDQRRLPLTVTQQSGATFLLQVSDNRNVALVGVYYLFAMNDSGVPSVAEDIQIAL